VLHCASLPRKPVRLAHPTHIRLSPELLQRLDFWRGDRMNRATAIRLLLDQVLPRVR
jgi:predicted DNA-binding protein